MVCLLRLVLFGRSSFIFSDSYSRIGLCSTKISLIPIIHMSVSIKTIYIMEEIRKWDCFLSYLVTMFWCISALEVPILLAALAATIPSAQINLLL